MKRRKENTKTDDKKHLRIRGENKGGTDTTAAVIETPPHTRRKPALTAKGKILLGNTSAYAEKTVSSRRNRAPNGKHLRIRGENSSFSINSLIVIETPPHTRRKPQRTAA